VALVTSQVSTLTSSVAWFCSLVQEAFITECSCLRRNTECDENCVCHTTGRCLNRAVQLGQGLRIGPDVREINSWGFDSYTRRNIHDGEPDQCFRVAVLQPHATAVILPSTVQLYR